MQKYCEKCSIPFTGDRCPECGKKRDRYVQPDDICFLTEKELIWSSMLADILKQENIPFMQKNVFGAGITLRTGPMTERVRFYVFYKHLAEATDIVNAYFSASGAYAYGGNGVFEGADE